MVSPFPNKLSVPSSPILKLDILPLLRFKPSFKQYKTPLLGSLCNQDGLSLVTLLTDKVLRAYVPFDDFDSCNVLMVPI